MYSLGIHCGVGLPRVVPGPNGVVLTRNGWVGLAILSYMPAMGYLWDVGKLQDKKGCFHPWEWYTKQSCGFQFQSDLVLETNEQHTYIHRVKRLFKSPAVLFYSMHALLAGRYRVERGLLSIPGLRDMLFFRWSLGLLLPSSHVSLVEGSGVAVDFPSLAVYCRSALTCWITADPWLDDMLLPCVEWLRALCDKKCLFNLRCVAGPEWYLSLT